MPLETLMNGCPASRKTNHQLSQLHQRARVIDASRKALHPLAGCISNPTGPLYTHH
jgi:hypothetical protein